MRLPSLLEDYTKYLAIEKDTKKDYIDLSNIHFVAPASVLPAIFFAKSNKIEKYTTYNQETKNHLNKILGMSQTNSNLLPLISVELNKSDAERDECLDRLNNNIRNLIFPDGNISYQSYGGNDTFPYITSEIIDNIKQHSKAKRVYSYCQRYPNADFIDVGILNDGDSIPRKYELTKDNFHNENGLNPYDVKNDCEAIFRSFNGISTKENFKGSIRLAKSIDDILDSGDLSLGINSSIRLITEGLGGSFLIASRAGICHLTKRKTKFINAKHNPIPGTFVCMRFERKYLKPSEYEKIAYNHDLINENNWKFKISNKT